jgi:Tol biopolymer transport system component
MTLEVNTLLKDRYRILGELGRGGMGAVYRGHDESLEVEVAVKENTVVRAAAERQFKREATLLASLRHPHLPRVTDHFVIPGQGQYLVMDFIKGVNALERLKQQQGPLPVDEVLRWAFEVLDAVQYLHSKTPPVLHRDIKPGNIKITPDGRAVLVDFGLAKRQDPDRPTTIGAKAYTPGYAPPEQYGQGRTSSRTDIYSLGATLYMLLTRQVPTDSIERLYSGKELAPVQTLNPAVPDHVAQAIEKALALQPQDRFDSAEDFADALKGQPEKIPAKELATLAPAAGTLERSPPKAPRLLAPILIGGLLLLGLGGGAFLLMSGILAGSTPAPTEVAEATQPPEPTDVPTSTEFATQTAAVVAAVVDTATIEPTITLTPTPAGTPVGSGRGEIAFVSERDGLPQIYLVDVEGIDVRQITAVDEGACQPVWSPDGEFLLFISPCRSKADFYQGSGIFMIKADGSELQPIFSHSGGAFDPDWSIGGIAFTVMEDGQPRVWIADANGANPRKISIGRSADRQPNWSPDGERMLFLNTSRTGSPDFFWMFKDGTFGGSNPDHITRGKPAVSADWSPLGKLVVYVSDSQIWVVDWEAKGFGATKLTIKAGNDDPDWSPDGRWIAFESWFGAETHDIYFMTASGAEQEQLTEHPAADYQPAWRP